MDEIEKYRLNVLTANFVSAGMKIGVKVDLTICPVCSRSAEIYRWRRNTAYHDEESNYLVSCEECYLEDVEYWKERWAEYYSGLL